MKSESNFASIWALVPREESPNAIAIMNGEEYREWLKEEGLWNLYRPGNVSIRIAAKDRVIHLIGSLKEDLATLESMDLAQTTIQILQGDVFCRQTYRRISYTLPQLAKAWQILQGPLRIEREKTHLEEVLLESESYRPAIRI